MTQAVEALKAANARRMAIAEIRAELANMTAADARQRAATVVHDPGLLEGMRVGVLVQSMPNLGPETAKRVVRYAGCSRDDHLRDLTDDERDALAHAIALPHALQRRLTPATAERTRSLAVLLEAEQERSAVLRAKCRELRERAA